MKHYILAKYREEVSAAEKDRIALEAGELFSRLVGKWGICGVELRKNCIARSNRYDLMIIIDMPKEALELYDGSPEHKLWIEKYGSYLLSKAIFDAEE